MRDKPGDVLTAKRPQAATIKRHGRRAGAPAKRHRKVEDCQKQSNDPSVEPNSLLHRIFAHAPADLIKSFSDDQISGLNAALVNADTRFHSIDFRTSLSFFGIPFYVTFLMGRERRSRERLAMEGQTQVHRVAIAHIILTLLIGLFCLAAFACVIYLLKSAVGIDLFDEHSPLHELFFE
ncbi:MAG: hypothetical protein ACR2PI_05070 [Hyphomicrobiaceae bacterium]